MTSITTVYKWLYPYLELYVCIWKKNNFKHVYKHISSWFESWNRKNKIKCVYKHLSLMVENLSTDYRDVSRLELNVCTLEKGKNNLKHMHEKLYTGFELNVGTKKIICPCILSWSILLVYSGSKNWPNVCLLQCWYNGKSN